ncbi:hypothetical protein GBAR_LOCUS27690, partial [Geodia barretti]
GGVYSFEEVTQLKSKVKAKNLHSRKWVVSRSQVSKKSPAHKKTKVY